jgi:hypothetical protein
MYYTQVLKEKMKPMQVQNIYLTKDQHLVGMVDWLVKDPYAWDWLCGWWPSKETKAILEWNR